jgi:phosphomannomutase
MSEITCFKAYDVRGRVPDQLNEDIARRIGRAYAEVIKPRQVVVGHDIRLTSQAIKAAVTQGLQEQGVDVYDIGQCGTEEIYFATSHAGMDGGIAVTASHNPKDYNGMKFVREDSRPISSDTGLLDIKALAEKAISDPAMSRRKPERRDCRVKDFRTRYPRNGGLFSHGWLKICTLLEGCAERMVRDPQLPIP